MATYSSILAWRIPGTEEPGGLRSMGLHRVGHDCMTNPWVQEEKQVGGLGPQWVKSAAFRTLQGSDNVSLRQDAFCSELHCWGVFLVHGEAQSLRSFSPNRCSLLLSLTDLSTVFSASSLNSATAGSLGFLLFLHLK